MTAEVIDLAVRVRELRLPAWAQKEMADLRVRLAEATAVIDAIVAPLDPERTNTIVHPDAEVSLGLAHGSTVRFKLGLHAHSYIDVRAAGSAVVVEASRPITVHPISSSALTIEVAR